MSRPEPARRIRLWAAGTTYAELSSMPYAFLLYYRIKLFEIGCLDNDVLKYKSIVLLAVAPFQNEKQTNKLLAEYHAMLLPAVDKQENGEEMLSLMSELENTIVTVDTKSAKAGMAQ